MAMDLGDVVRCPILLDLKISESENISLGKRSVRCSSESCFLGIEDF